MNWWFLMGFTMMKMAESVGFYWFIVIFAIAMMTETNLLVLRAMVQEFGQHGLDEFVLLFFIGDVSQIQDAVLDSDRWTIQRFQASVHIIGIQIVSAQFCQTIPFGFVVCVMEITDMIFVEFLLQIHFALRWHTISGHQPAVSESMRESVVQRLWFSTGIEIVISRIVVPSSQNTTGVSFQFRMTWNIDGHIVVNRSWTGGTSWIAGDRNTNSETGFNHQI